MKTILMLAALALPACAQSFDFSLLDKIGAGAKNSSTIDLDPNTMKMASGLLGSGKDSVSIKKLVAGLSGMTIRSYEFDKPGKYNEADLEPFRAFLKQQKWSRIVDSKEEKEHAEIYIQPQQDNRVGGLAIISAEPREVTVVYISGSISVDDLGKLSGTMGIPGLDLGLTAPPATPKGKKKE